MNNSFNIGVSSSLTHSKAVDIWADNLANVNTTAFKGTTPEFATLFESKVVPALNSPATSGRGNGIRLSGTNIDMRQGSAQSTDRTFDLLLKGEGFFAVSHTNHIDAKNVAYTRNGNFSPDASGFLTNDNRDYLLGSNFNNIISNNGTHSIDINAPQGVASPDIATLGKLFTPSELSHPFVPSSQGKFALNLQNSNPIHPNPASRDIHLEALLNKDGKSINTRNGESLLLSVGESDTVFEQGKLTQEITLINDTFDTQKTVDFTVDGTTLSVTWQGPKSRSEIRDLFDNAFKASGLQASFTETPLGFRVFAKESIQVSNSNFALISNSLNKVVTYDTTREANDNFTTFGELEDLTINTIEEVYGNNSVRSHINQNGAWNIVANDKPVALQFKNTNFTNELLLNQLSSFKQDILPNTTAKTLDFLSSKETFQQGILGVDGKNRNLDLSFSRIETQEGNLRSTWQLESQISQTETVTGDIDAKNILFNDKTVDLKNGQGFWVATGDANISKSIHGLDYFVKIPQDFQDGVDANLSFSINDTPISLTAPDGSTGEEISLLLKKTLNEAGFSATITDHTTVSIQASNFGHTDLKIDQGSSNIEGLKIPSQFISKLTYDDTKQIQGGFQTLNEFAQLLQNSAQSINIPIDTSIENGQVVLKNTGSDAARMRFFSDDNGNDAFSRALSPRNQTLSPLETITSEVMTYNRPASSTSSTVSFDGLGNIVDSDTLLILDNEGIPFEFDLSKLTNISNPTVEHQFSHNGIIEGDLQEYTINNDGMIIATFDNKQSVSLGEISVLHFQNDEGLERIGSSLYKVGENSGEAFFYTDANGDILHSTNILNRALENSNVDTAAALTNLIVMQRAFDGAAKVITTGDELLQNVINMKR
jgi:flagellar hook-basal body protein